MIRTTTAFLLGAASFAVLGATQKTRYESLAPETHETAAQIAALPVSLTAAIATAEKAIDGRARSAELALDTDPPRIEVDVFGAKAAARVAIDAETGEILGREPLHRLPGLQPAGEPYVSETGLTFYDIVEGDGDEVESQGAMVRFQVNGFLSDGTLFDSSYEDGKHRMLPLERTVPGFREGVSTMKVGGKRKLILPYKLAYGEHGNPPVVPHRAVVIYDVELLEVLP